MKDWEKEMLFRMREIVKKKEGSVTFEVKKCYNKDEFQWTIEGWAKARGRIA